MSRMSFLRTPNRFFVCYIVLFCLLLFSGCAGTHLYNKANHETALKAENSFKDAELSKSLAEERDRLEEFSRREIEVVRRHTLAMRDAKLVAIIGCKKDPWKKLEGEINSRLSTLVGTDTAGFVTKVNKISDLKQQLKELETSYNLKLQPKKPIEEHLPEYNKKSKDCKELQSNLDSWVSGEYGEKNKEIAEIDKNLEDTNKELEERKKDYVNALSYYESAVKNNSPDIMKIAAELTKKLDELGKSINEEEMKKLDLSNHAKLGYIAKLEEQQEYIRKKIAQENKIKDNSKKEGTESDTKADIEVAKMITLTISSLNDLYKNINTLPLNVLILQNERLRLEIEGLKKHVANEDEQISLMRQKQDSIKMEIDLLVESHKWLEQAKSDAANKPTEKSIIESFKEPVNREIIGRILLAYANSWSVGRVAQEEIDYLLIASDHKQALEDSENALAQWENLIGIPLTQIVQLHASGITKEDIAHLVQAIITAGGLTAIGVGVN